MHNLWWMKSLWLHWFIFLFNSWLLLHRYIQQWTRSFSLIRSCWIFCHWCQGTWAACLLTWASFLLTWAGCLLTWAACLSTSATRLSNSAACLLTQSASLLPYQICLSAYVPHQICDDQFGWKNSIMLLKGIRSSPYSDHLFIFGDSIVSRLKNFLLWWRLDFYLRLLSGCVKM